MTIREHSTTWTGDKAESNTTIDRIEHTLLNNTQVLNGVQNEKQNGLAMEHKRRNEIKDDDHQTGRTPSNRKREKQRQKRMEEEQ